MSIFVEETLFSFVNPNHEYFFTSDASRFDQFIRDGWEPVATAFDSYSGSFATDVHHLYDSASDRHFWTASKNEIKTLKSNGWKHLKSDSITGSSIYQDGLVGVFRLENPETLDSTWLTDIGLIEDREENGWINRGIQWYAPIDTGEVLLSNRVVDPESGLVSIDYSLDDLHLLQFSGFENILNARIIGTTDSGSTWISQDILTKDLSGSTGDNLLNGNVTINLQQTLGASLEEFDALTISFNTKYGKNPAESNGLYGFVRSFVVNLLDEDLSVNSSSDLSDIGFQNLYGFKGSNADRFSFLDSEEPIQPGKKYELVDIVGKPLAGVDWSNVQFTGGKIEKNDLTSANLQNLRTLVYENKIKGPYVQSVPPSVKNNNMSHANLAYSSFVLLHGNQYSTYYNTVDNSQSRSLILRTQAASLTMAEASKILVINESGSSVTVNIDSPQFRNSSNLSPGGETSAAGYNAGSGRYDLEGSIVKDGKKIQLLADNPSLAPAYLEIDGRDRGDDGAYSYLSWDFEDSNDMKTWIIRVR